MKEKDWVRWHDAYGTPHSHLSRRLEVVETRLAGALEDLEALQAGPARPAKVLSLCAGDGRDVVAVLGSDRGRRRVHALLVEWDPVLAGRAREAARAVPHPATVEVRCADAGALDSFRDFVPVDVLMLCGIFGNIEHAAVRELVQLVPRLVVPGGYVIWTRGGSEPDRRPEIRRWFRAAGMPEVAFDGSPEHFGVGLNAVEGSDVRSGALPERVFTFVQ
jgi:hypothetical protein